MTKRKRANYHKYLRLERTLAAHHIPDGSEVAQFLDLFAPFEPVMLRSHDVRCKACDVVNQLGDTVFVNNNPGHTGPVLCYGCGIGWEIYKERLTLLNAADIPAIGGPNP